MQQGVLGRSASPASPAPHPTLLGSSSAPPGVCQKALGWGSDGGRALALAALGAVLDQILVFSNCSLPGATEPSEEMGCWARLGAKERVYRDIRAGRRRKKRWKVGVGRCWEWLRMLDCSKERFAFFTVLCAVVLDPLFLFPENSHYRHKLQIWDAAIL